MSVTGLLAPPLAHHMMVAALPFFGPVLVIATVLTVMAVRDRRRRRVRR
ncbi:MAG: hypothetical protein ACXVFT_18395 [Solirubrobacteraceae bacterium]